MTNEQLNKKIEALKAELDQLRGPVVREPVDAAAMGRWQDEMRQGAERRALRQYAWSAQELAAMNAACPNAQDIVHDNRAPQGPGDGTGWAREIPIGNPPGTRWVDAQLMPRTLRTGAS